MKLLNSKPVVVIAGVLAVGLVLMLFSRKASAAVSGAADSIGTALAPTSSDNIFSGGVNAVGDALDDGDGSNDSFSLGGSLYDLFNPTYDPNAPYTADRDSLINERQFIGPPA